MPTEQIVSYGKMGAAANVFQHAIESRFAVPEAVDRLRTAIEAHGLWVLHEIDPQALLKRGGYTINAALQISFFHPHLMARLLAADHAALLEAPLKFAVIEQPNGLVQIRWNDPAHSFARYRDAALRQLGEELTITCQDIIRDSFETQATATA